MSMLSHAEIVARLAATPAWHHRGNALERHVDCRNFDGSIAFVNRVAAIANALDHHPDVTVSWNDVTLTISSHDAGGITERDFAFIAAIEADLKNTSSV